MSKCVDVLILLIVLAASIWDRPANAEEKCINNLTASVTFPFGENKCPSIGRMGVVKLAIPQSYLFSAVHYEGVDIWNSQSVKNQAKPTFDTPIADFSMRLRLSNFKPIQTKQDWEDYGKLGQMRFPESVSPGNQWIYVEFLFTKDHHGCSAMMQCYFDGIMRDEPHWGPFIPQKNEEYGLNHYLSIQRPTVAVEPGQTNEFFYDPKTHTTLITCTNKLMKVSPYAPLIFCKLNFVIPELDATIRVNFAKAVKDDIAEWPQIEQEVRRIVKSFVSQ